ELEGMMTKQRTLAAVLTVVLLGAVAWAAEPVAVLTEIHTGDGVVEVMRTGDNTWVAPAPLQALRAGDQIRASGRASAVLIFSGGRGPQSVSASNSPLIIEAPVASNSDERLRTLLTGLTEFLLGKHKDLDYSSISSRDIRPPPMTILAPRDTRLL